MSDSVYRKWARRFGAGIVFTEMVSAEGLRRGNRKTIDLLEFDEIERPIGVQLFDDKPAVIAEAAKIAEGYGFDLIDINLGCPARKITKKSAGAKLLEYPERAIEVVSAAKKAVGIPVSVKIRAGWKNPDTYIELIPALVDCGVEFITFHPRTAEQFFSGKADWGKIGRAVRLSPIPIVGNGDICTGEDAARMLDRTGCRAVMLGRASLGYPWIFRQAVSCISGEKPPPEPDNSERLKTCRAYIRDLVEFYGEERALNIARKHVVWFTKGIPNKKYIRERALSVGTIEEMIAALEIERTELLAI